MDSKKFQEFKKRLTQKKAELEDQLNKIGQEDTDGRYPVSKYATKFPDFGHQEEENAGEVETYTTNLGIEADLEKSLKEVDEALQRLAEGNYGKCQSCSKDIEEARLDAYPEATLCLECIKKDRK